MNIKHPLLKLLAVYVAVALLSLTPMASMHRAAMALGLKTVLVGGLVGGAALLALGALAGPASAVGAVGCAGTGFLGSLGAVLGTAVSGITGIMAATGTLALGTMATLGLMLGGAGLAIACLIGSPWVIVPALVLGAGLLAYVWGKNRFGTAQAFDRRVDRPFNTSLLDAGSRLANQSQSGANVGSSGSFLDRVRSIFDRDRRDDSFILSTNYVDSNGYVRQGNDIMSRINSFFNGSNSGYAGDPRMYMNGYGTTTGLTSATLLSTDRSGRVVIGQNSNVYRTGLTPTAPEATTVSEVATPEGSDELTAAEAVRKAAYERLIQAVKAPVDGATAPGTSNLGSSEVQKAIQDYKDADRFVKEITGRLQAQEKQ